MKKQNYLVTSVCLLISLLSRVIPHPANVAAMMSFAVLLPQQLSKRLAVCVTVFTLLLSDVYLAAIYHSSIIGCWTLFSYSGFILISWLANYVPRQRNTYLWGYLLGSTFFYWLWTNFGTWLVSGMYPHSTPGLFSCYVAALPFLRLSLIGNVIWFVILSAVTQWLETEYIKKIHYRRA